MHGNWEVSVEKGSIYAFEMATRVTKYGHPFFSVRVQKKLVKK